MGRSSRLDPRAQGPDAYSYAGALSHRGLGVQDSVLERPRFRAFYLEVVAALERGDRVIRRPDSLRIERSGTLIAEVLFSGQAPRLLDFTATTIVRRFPTLSA